MNVLHFLMVVGIIFFLGYLLDKFSGKVYRHIEARKERKHKGGYEIMNVGFNVEELQNIIDMHNVGCSDEKIGVEIGRSDGTISEILSALRKNGVINFVEEGE